MITNFFFFIKIIRTFKEYNILKLIRKNIKFKFLFDVFTFLISLGKKKSNEYKESADGIRIAQALNQLGPSFIKLGQLISTRPDIIGNVVAEDMALLRDSLPPFSKDEAIKIIEQEFQKDIDQIFKNFSEPVAAASIAQVHFAKIMNESQEIEVAVKILRPNIKEIIEDEMKRLEWLTKFLENFQEFKRLQAGSIVKKAREVIKFELDLRYEAAAASELSENTKRDENFKVPSVFWDKVSQKVLTIEKVNGLPIDKIDNTQIDKQQAAKNLIVTFLRQSIRDGYFHADLHQGNLFIDESSNLIAVDFGIMGRLDKQNRRYLAEIIYGFIRQDYHDIAKIHKEAGLIDKNESIEDFSQALRSIGEPIINQKAKNISMGNVLVQLFEITKQFNMSLQPQLLLLQKTMIIVEGVARNLDPNINFWEVSKPEIEEWLKDELGIKNRLKETQETLKVLARKVPDLPDFLSRAENAIDTISEMNKEKVPSPNYLIRGGVVFIIILGIIALI